MKNILVISNQYPYKTDMSHNFVRNTVVALADAGYNCVVLSRQSLTKVLFRNRIKHPTKWIDSTKKGAGIVVYQPYVLTLSNVKFLSSLNKVFFEIVQKRIFRKISKTYQFDLVYAHFWSCGLRIAKLTSDDLPVVVISGESKISLSNVADALLKKIKGVVFVSSKNLIESRELGLLRYEPESEVIPNAIDPLRFYPIPQEEARKKTGIVADKTTVGIFVGTFCERKGINRVLEAAKGIPNLKLICVGKSDGTCELQSREQILFQGSVKNDELVYYLNSADFFVLPTRAEGCCNAILEALACGLPIISSNLPFNNEILDDECSIRVDPDNVGELAEAMKALCNSEEERTRLSTGALEKSRNFLIQNRITRIVNFFDEVCEAQASAR